MKHNHTKLCLRLPPLNNRSQQLSSSANYTSKQFKANSKPSISNSPILKQSMSLENIIISEYMTESKKERDLHAIKVCMYSPSHLTRKFKRNTVVKFMQRSTIIPFSHPKLPTDKAVHLRVS